MSEREPITAELRRIMNHTTMAGVPLVEIGEFEFGHRCDAIDAVHAQLERENAELRERVAELDESVESMHETDAWKLGYDEGFASADDWLGQHEDAMAEHGWIRLPLDADGVPIHIGDVMDGTCPSGKHVNGTVNAIGDGVFWLSNVQFSLKPNYMHHYHAPTVEDVLTKFGIDWEYEDNCEDRAALLAEYASKLRLAGDAE